MKQESTGQMILLSIYCEIVESRWYEKLEKKKKEKKILYKSVRDCACGRTRAFVFPLCTRARVCNFAVVNFVVLSRTLAARGDLKRGEGR